MSLYFNLEPFLLNKNTSYISISFTPNIAISKTTGVVVFDFSTPATSLSFSPAIPAFTYFSSCSLEAGKTNIFICTPTNDLSANTPYTSILTSAVMPSTTVSFGLTVRSKFINNGNYYLVHEQTCTTQKTANSKSLGDINNKISLDTGQSTTVSTAATNILSVPSIVPCLLQGQVLIKVDFSNTPFTKNNICGIDCAYNADNSLTVTKAAGFLANSDLTASFQLINPISEKSLSGSYFIVSVSAYETGAGPYSSFTLKTTHTTTSFTKGSFTYTVAYDASAKFWQSSEYTLSMTLQKPVNLLTTDIIYTFPAAFSISSKNPTLTKFENTAGCSPLTPTTTISSNSIIIPKPFKDCSTNVNNWQIKTTLTIVYNPSPTSGATYTASTVIGSDAIESGNCPFTGSYSSTTATVLIKLRIYI